MSRHDHPNPETGVHSASGAPPFLCNDGDEGGKHLLQFIRTANDRSSVSTELAAGIVYCPSHYHLSHFCSNLLRPVAELLNGDLLV